MTIKALPMVTMVMGGVCEGTLSKVVTDNEDCDEPRTFQFDRYLVAVFVNIFILLFIMSVRIRRIEEECKQI